MSICLFASHHKSCDSFDIRYNSTRITSTRTASSLFNFSILRSSLNTDTVNSSSSSRCFSPLAAYYSYHVSSHCCHLWQTEPHFSEVLCKGSPVKSWTFIGHHWLTVLLVSFVVSIIIHVYYFFKFCVCRFVLPCLVPR